MKENEKQYLLLIGLHILLGFAFYAAPIVSKIYAAAVLVVGALYVIKHRNRNHEVLLVAAYIIGCEVMLRITSANLLYEYGKYAVLIFIFLGTYYSGFSKNGVPYWIFLLLLVPGVVLATQTLGPLTDMRKSIAFNISGPVCLGVSALYCYQRKVTQDQVHNILLWMGLPIITITVYLMLYTPDLRESITGTASNYTTSGGFGPNQVATALGLGMFIFVSRLIFKSPTKLLMLVNLVIAVNVTFRGLVTFSRGGMITGMVMVIIMLWVTYFKVNPRGRQKMNLIFVMMGVLFFSLWTWSSIQTGGLIEKRYANQDAAGKEKESRFSGREALAETEIEDFLEHPILGIGVARGAELRLEAGQGGLSHNEITRMLAEHGTFGIVGLMILFFTPVILYMDNKNHLLLMCFLMFWLLTINHAAMRLAAPAFVYALSLLKVVPNEETPALHRQ